jgi:hypothetical protein
MRKLIRTAGLAFAHIFGTRVTDFQNGQSLGKALIFPWRGKVHVIGLEKDVRAIFQSQKRLTYWKQEIVFTTHPTVDFPKEKSTIDQPK